MKTIWNTWLSELAKARKGGVRLQEGASRGRLFEMNITLPGDWLSATLRGEVRASPDATGDPLATFTISAPVTVGDDTLFVASLAAGSGPNSTGSLPLDRESDGVQDFVFDLLLNDELLIGGLLPVMGRVTI